MSCLYVGEYLLRVVSVKGSLHNVHEDGLNAVTCLFVVGVIGRLLQMLSLLPLRLVGHSPGEVVGLLSEGAASYIPQWLLSSLPPLTLTVVSCHPQTALAVLGGVSYRATLSLRKLTLLFRGLRCLRIANLNDDIMVRTVGNYSFFYLIASVLFTRFLCPV